MQTKTKKYYHFISMKMKTRTKLYSHQTVILWQLWTMQNQQVGRYVQDCGKVEGYLHPAIQYNNDKTILDFQTVVAITISFLLALLQ